METKWQVTKPPDIKWVPRKLEYLYRYNVETAYIPIRGTLESNKSYRRRLFECLLSSINAAAVQPQMRIQKHWQDTNWNQAWEIVRVAPITENARNE